MTKRKTKSKILAKTTKRNKLTKEEFQEMKINHLEMEGLQKDLKNIGIQIENLERAKAMEILRRNDVKASIQKIGQVHNNFMDRLERQTGISIRGKTINPESYEIMD